MVTNDVQVDMLNLSTGQVSGDLATRLSSSGMDVGVLRPFVGNQGCFATLQAGTDKAHNIRVNAATLRKDEWKMYDTAVLAAALQRLNAVKDLMDRNLVYRIPNGLGKTVLEYEDESDISDAEMNMSAVSKSKNDQFIYDMKYLPLPIIHKDFQINIRQLTASRERGVPMDVRNAQGAARKVSEYAENLLANGSSDFAYGGGTIYGYTDAPNRNIGTLTVAWGAATGEQILADVIDMKQDSIDDRHYGPWVLYIPTAYQTALDADFKAGSDKSIRERLLEVEGVTEIKVIDKMTATEVVLVEMMEETVRLVEALPIQTVQWDTEGGMILHYKVMTIMVPQIRADQNSRSGIVNYSAP